MGILAIGGGAGKGLQDYLEQALHEQTLAEAKRHNMAQEAAQMENLHLNTQLRGDTLKANQDYRADQLKQQQSKELNDSLEERGIGDPVTEPEYASERKAGVPAGLYEETPGKKLTLSGFTSLPEGQRPDVEPDPGNTIQAPRLMSFKGTAKRREERDKNETDRLREQRMGAGAGGVNTQETTRRYTGPSNKLIKNGEIIDANRNPRTNKLEYRGIDVTNLSEHYEKPPNKTEVGIWTDKGYVSREGALRDAAAGNPAQPKMTSQTQAMSEGAKMLKPLVNRVAGDAEALDKVGLFGPMMSRVRSVATKLGTVQSLNSADLDEQQRAMVELGNAIKSDPALASDRLAGRFAAGLGLLASGTGRVHGGARGGGSIQMIDYMKDLLSGSSTLPLFLGRLDTLNFVLEDYAAGPNPQAPSPDAGAAPPESAYDRYLKRTQKP